MGDYAIACFFYLQVLFGVFNYDAIHERGGTEMFRHLSVVTAAFVKVADKARRAILTVFAITALRNRRLSQSSIALNNLSKHFTPFTIC